MRLAVRDIVGGDHHFRRRYVRELQASSCQVAPSGCDHAPVAGRNRADEINGAGHHGNTFAIRSFAALQLPDFRFWVEMGSNGANHFDGADAVSDGHHFLLVNSALAGPDAPLAVNGAGGIDENSVKVE